MKKITAFLLILLMTTLLSSCSNGSSDNTITVGATSVPHAVILEQVADILSEDNITLVIKESDYSLLNQGTVDGSYDANFFQHIPFLENFNTNSGNNLVSVGPVHIEPLGVYSNNIADIGSLQNGDSVAIPNDGANETRALRLLEEQNIITIDPNKTGHLTPLDIVENPLNLEFTEIEAASLARALDVVTIAIINGNYAIQADLNPAEDALVLENPTNSPYANVLVTTEEKANNPQIQALYNALTSDTIKEFIESNYSGSVIPAFN